MAATKKHESQVMYSFMARLSLKLEDIEFLRQQDNMSGYIRELIQKDITEQRGY